MNSPRYKLIVPILARIYAGAIVGGTLFIVLHIFLSGMHLVRIGGWPQTAEIGAVNGLILGIISCFLKRESALLLWATLVDLLIFGILAIVFTNGNSLALMEILSNLNYVFPAGSLIASTATAILIVPASRLLQSQLWQPSRKET